MPAIELRPGFCVFAIMLAALDRNGAVLPIVCAMALHELAHAAAMLACGGRIRRLTLRFADLYLEAAGLGYRQEFFAALAGPLANLACGAAFRVRWPAFAAYSLILGLYNLLPVWPLDGGRLLRTLLRMRWGAAGVDASQTLGLLFGLGLLGGAVFAARRWDAGVWPAVTAGALLVRLLRSRYAEKAVAFPAAEQ